MIGSLFSGIGGLELGLEWAGLGPVVWQVEIDPYCRRVLARHWPDAKREVTDVREATKRTLGFVGDASLVICGGFPCQDVSGAGKGAGLEGARSGLWFEFARVIRELRPAGVVIENVSSGARRWLPHILADLAAAGYRARALGIGARDVGAPHRRARIFVCAVADADGAGRIGEGLGVSGVAQDAFGARSRGDARRGREGRAAMADPDGERPRGLGGLLDGGRAAQRHDAVGCSPGPRVADPDSEQLRIEQQRHPGRRSRGVRDPRRAEPGEASAGPAEPVLGGSADGLPAGLDPGRRSARPLWPAGRGEPQHAWEPPRTVSPGAVWYREERCHALGNAVVPQCAMIAGLVLREMMRGAA